VLQQHDADAAGLQRQAGLTRLGMAGGERRVQGDAGVGHTEAAGPDQPHAVAAADAQQLRAGRTAESRRDYGQGPDAPLPALLGDTDTAAAGAATTARSTSSGSAAADGTHRTPFSSATLGLTA